MKKFLILTIGIFSAIMTMAQTVTSSDRIIAKQQLTLKTNTLDSFQKSGAFTSDRATPTSLAVQNLINSSKATSVTYSQLTTLISGNSLKAGAIYLLSDFRTKYTQRKTGAVKTASTEPLLLTAVSSDSLSEFVVSQVYPSDMIKYTVNNSADTSADRGIIYYREDSRGNSTQYDFRNIKFPRYNADCSGMDTLYAGGPYSASQWEWFIFSPSAGVYQLRLAAAAISDLTTFSNNSWTFDAGHDYHVLADDFFETVMTLTVDVSSMVERYTFDNGSGIEYSSHFNGIKIVAYNPGYQPKGVVLTSSGSASQSVIGGNSYDCTLSYIHNSTVIDIELSYIPSISNSHLKNFYAVTTDNPIVDSRMSDLYDVYGYAWNINYSNVEYMNSSVITISFNNVDCVEFLDNTFWGAYTFSNAALFNSKIKKFIDKKTTGVYRYWYVNDSGTLIQTTF